MRHPVQGLHHVTATVNDAQHDLDFCLGGLGLRLVKKTVNFDNRRVYHFYYATELGLPGTVWTTFPYKGQGVRIGEKGAGQITVTSLSVPTGSLPFWKERCRQQRISVREAPGRFGEESIVLEDPSAWPSSSSPTTATGATRGPGALSAESSRSVDSTASRCWCTRRIALSTS